MRLDKYLCDAGIGTRSSVKEMIKKGQVRLNGEICKKPDEKIEESTAVIDCNGQNIIREEHTYIMFYKPQGIVSATEDRREETVLDFLRKKWEERESRPFPKGLFPAGRLDKDTEGLLLLTNDGMLAHRLLSPGKHVPKQYLAVLSHDLTQEQIAILEQGADIGEAQPAKPAVFSWQDREKAEALLTVTEGKFHQVKRMFASVGCQVLSLKRLSMGSLVLDKTLAPGQYRPLLREELESLLKLTKLEDR